jgi:hypothetical protein
MHIEFARSGGFAGLRLSVIIDTEDLPKEQASTLESMIKDSDFFELPEKIIPPSPLPDRFEYHVVISDDQAEHSIVASEAVVPERLKPLLNLLTTLAIAGKGTDPQQKSNIKK